MKPSIRQLRQYTAVAGTMFLAAGAGPAILGDGSDSTLRIGGFTVMGDVVQIAVLNPSGQTLTGTVFVRVMLEDRKMGAMASVTVSEGQKAFVQVPLPSPVEEVLETWVVLDDGSPF